MSEQPDQDRAAAMKAEADAGKTYPEMWPEHLQPQQEPEAQAG